LKRKWFLLGALLALPLGRGLATEVVNPRLLVAIAVDQFSADLYAEYRPLYTAGLKRMSSGVVFPSGYQSHAATETCPGHSTILTGSHPARTGIIANEWFDQSLTRDDKQLYCSEDPTLPGSSLAHYTPSVRFLKVPTLGDRLKQVDPRTRVVSVAGKDRAALMMGGHHIDQAWFFSGKGFSTLPGVTSEVPHAVEELNAKLTAAMRDAYTPELPEACRSRSAPISAGPRTVGTLPIRAAGDWKGLRASVEFDRATTDLAIGLIRELQLGRNEATDVLSIGLSGTDPTGHAFGTEGAEMCAQILSVDQNVGRILTALDQTGVPYAVVLTADHGGHDLPERNRQRGFEDAVRVDPMLSASAIGKRLAKRFHLREPVLLGGFFGDVYLSTAVPKARRAAVLKAARQVYRSHPQVAAVFTAQELSHHPAPTVPVDEWTLADRFKASFDPSRSGDLLIALKPHVTPIPEVAGSGSVATHGSAWNYDRRVPMLFYRPGLRGFEQPLAVETVDILPTLAALVNLRIPAGEIDGRCLEIDPDQAPRCPKRP